MTTETREDIVLCAQSLNSGPSIWWWKNSRSKYKKNQGPKISADANISLLLDRISMGM